MLWYKGKIARTLYGKQKQVTKGDHITIEFSARLIPYVNWLMTRVTAKCLL